MDEAELERLRSWEGREESSEDLIAATPARALAVTLDHDAGSIVEGAILPPLYHWLYFPVLARSSELAADGHAKKGGFMPPVPFPRRMFAGARIDYHGALRIGERVSRTATIRSVSYKQGRSGPLIFVTVRYSIYASGSLKLVEEQDIAYRPASESRAGPPAARPAPPKADFSRVIVPDERLLFRFSALTFNAHRIHYDLPFARGEGYSALVVHGPLTAVLLADLVARGTGARELEHFSFRASRAFVLGDTIRLLGWSNGREVDLSAVGDGGVVGLTARATLRRRS